MDRTEGKQQALPAVVEVERLQRLREEGADIRLLDVRTPAEFESAHIRGAYNVPLDTLGEHREELRSHVEEPVVLVCRSGQRARRAEQALREIGMENLHVLEGGIAAWEAAGQPVERGRQRWSLERQVRLAAGSLVLAGTLGGMLVSAPLVWLAALIGAGLAFSAATDTCGMGMVLSRLPYNRPADCDVGRVVEALKRGEAAPGGKVPAGAGEARTATTCCG